MAPSGSTASVSPASVSPSASVKPAASVSPSASVSPYDSVTPSEEDFGTVQLQFV